MEPKKNPKADLNRNSFLFFSIGLVVMLSVSLILIEWKTYDKEQIDTGTVNMNQLDLEDVPITEQIKKPPPPPPPPPAPEKIEVVEDDEEVEEVVIKSTETDQEEEITIEEVEEVNEVIEDVPFSAIQDVPVFPGCEKYKTNDERKKCMSNKIKKFVNKRFDTSLGSDLGLSGINRVYVQFKIDKNGDVVNVRARASHPKLKEEGERVVKKLPGMKPGKQRGQEVGVIYQLPITFKIQD